MDGFHRGTRSRLEYNINSMKNNLSFILTHAASVLVHGRRKQPPYQVFPISFLLLSPFIVICYSLPFLTGAFTLTRWLVCVYQISPIYKHRVALTPAFIDPGIRNENPEGISAAESRSLSFYRSL